MMLEGAWSLRISQVGEFWWVRPVTGSEAGSCGGGADGDDDGADMIDNGDFRRRVSCIKRILHINHLRTQTCILPYTKIELSTCHL